MTNTAPARPVPDAPHRPAMLAAGWLAVRDIAGNVTAWKCPHSGVTWDDESAELFWQAGDAPSVPRIKEIRR